MAAWWLIGVAAAIKFVPLALLAPLAHAGTTRRGRQTLVTGVGALVVLGGCTVWMASYHHGLRDFERSTWGFQFNRSSPFSPWGLYHWRMAQRITQGVLGLAILGMFAWPRARDFRQVAAGMAAVMLAIEITLQHWFYLYIPWFFGPLLIVLVAQRELRAAPPVTVREPLADGYAQAHDERSDAGRIDTGSRLVPDGTGAR